MVNVESLYCNIPHYNGLRVIRSFLMNLSSDLWAYCEFLLELLRFILTNNVLIFHDTHIPPGTGLGDGNLVSYVSLYILGTFGVL